jgi:hypothetical protein
MRHPSPLVLATLLLAVSGGAIAGQEPWLHVQVRESGEEPASVDVNLPLRLVEKLLPVVEAHGIHGGKIEAKIGDRDISVRDLREAFRAVASSPDGTWIAVKELQESVRLVKRGSELRIEGSNEGAERGRVEIRLPLAVAEALLSGDGEELNVVAAIAALLREKPRDLITVQDSKARVRIWVGPGPEDE